MHKHLLALALIAALTVPVAVLAATPDASYAIGVHGAPGWTVKVLNPRFSAIALTYYLDGRHGDFGSDKGAGIAQVIGEAYASNGAAQVAVHIDTAAHTVNVVEGHGPPSSGAYAGYLSATSHATRRQIEAAGRKMSNRARADGAKATLDIGSPDAEGSYTVTTAATPAESAPVTGSVGYTNQGARYAGSDLVTASGRADVGYGNEIDASAAHGLSNASSDSYGGRYNAESLSLTHYSRFGGTKFYANNTTYQTGGPLEIYDLSGRVSTWGMQQIIPLSQAWTVYGGVQETHANERLGIVGWDDQERYTTALVGFSRDTAHTNGNIQFDHGVGNGSRSLTVIPLQGTFNPHYGSLKASFSAWALLGGQGWIGRAGVSGQVSSHDTPTNELWTIGGPFRGQAYRNGFAAGIRGYAVWSQVEAPGYMGLTPYIGVDRASADYAVGMQRTSTAVTPACAIAWLLMCRWTWVMPMRLVGRHRPKMATVCWPT